jgi:hypothetical protein
MAQRNPFSGCYQRLPVQPPTVQPIPPKLSRQQEFERDLALQVEDNLHFQFLLAQEERLAPVRERIEFLSKRVDPDYEDKELDRPSADLFVCNQQTKAYIRDHPGMLTRGSHPRLRQLYNRREDLRHKLQVARYMARRRKSGWDRELRALEAEWADELDHATNK